MGQQAWTILLTALVLGGGVILGATLLAEDQELAPPPASDERVDAPPPAPRAQPALASVGGDASTMRRVAALEAEVRALRMELEAGRAAMKPLVAMYEQAKERGLVGVDSPGGAGAISEDMPLEVIEFLGAEGPGYVSRTLGLNPKRAAALAAEHKEILAQVKDLEKRHAEVTVDGDTTTIQIGAFGSDGETLRRRWDDWKRKNWTAQETRTHTNSGGDNSLFNGRLGAGARTIKIRETAGNIKVTESATSSDGEEFSSEIMGPAIARSAVLENYLHLLK